MGMAGFLWAWLVFCGYGRISVGMAAFLWDGCVSVGWLRFCGDGCVSVGMGAVGMAADAFRRFDRVTGF